MTNPKPVKLEPEARRVDLTVREMVSILGGLIGSLCENSHHPFSVREAVRWWAENDAAWTHFDGTMSEQIKAALLEKMKSGSKKPISLKDISKEILDARSKGK